MEQDVLMCLGDEKLKKIETISTGIFSIDEALGIGGLPVGRIIEIFGPESSGKTTFCLHAMAEAQKKGPVAFIDMEHAIDLTYANNLGVDASKLMLSQPDHAEQALDIVELLIKTNKVKMIVIDSVAALIPKAELEGTMEDSVMGLQARIMSKALRKITPVISKTGTVVIFINQLREKIGVMFGSPETTTGGKGLKFYASIRIDIRKSGTIAKVDGQAASTPTKVKIIKNKLAVPFKEVMVDIVYGEGICKYNDLIEIALTKGIITKKGSWFMYGDTKTQGKPEMVKILKNDPKLFEEIKTKLTKKND